MIECVTIGCSAGGLRALQVILSEFPSDFAAPILIVQHVAADAHEYLSSLLNAICPLRVKTAEAGETLCKGTVYLAPSGFHMMVEQDKTIFLSTERKVNYSRPAIDPLFESAAEAYFDKLCAVLLTGANSDGAKGMKRVDELSGTTIVQNPDSAEVSAMPASAVATTNIDYILDLQNIAPKIIMLSEVLQ